VKVEHEGEVLVRVPALIRSGLVPYGIAAVALLCAIATTFAIIQVVGLRQHPAIGSSYLLTILAAAWWGGYGPGTAASLVAYFFIPYLFAPGFTAASVDPVKVAVTLGVSLLVSRVASVRRNAESRLRIANEALEARVRDRVSAVEARDWLHTTLASIGNGVIATDVSGRITFLNGVAAGLIGSSSQDQASGRPLRELLHLVDENGADMKDDPVAAVVRTEAPLPAATFGMVRNSGGGLTAIEYRGSIRKQQSVLGVVLVIRDISARRASENALRESEERLRLALDAGRIGVWDWNLRDGSITWSPRVYEIHGWIRESLTDGWSSSRGLCIPRMRVGTRPHSRSTRGKVFLRCHFSYHPARWRCSLDHDSGAGFS
jgi:PAS domain S-box-containing protein